MDTILCFFILFNSPIFGTWPQDAIDVKCGAEVPDDHLFEMCRSPENLSQLFYFCHPLQKKLSFVILSSACEDEDLCILMVFSDQQGEADVNQAEWKQERAFIKSCKNTVGSGGCCCYSPPASVLCCVKCHKSIRNLHHHSSSQIILLLQLYLK